MYTKYDRCNTKYNVCICTISSNMEEFNMYCTPFTILAIAFNGFLSTESRRPCKLPMRSNPVIDIMNHDQFTYIS